MTKARDISDLLDTNGQVDNNDIANVDASKVSTGTLDTARVPNLDTSKITTGTLSADRIDNNSLTNITSLPSGVGGLALQSVQTTDFTAVLTIDL